MSPRKVGGLVQAVGGADEGSGDAPHRRKGGGTRGASTPSASEPCRDIGGPAARPPRANPRKTPGLRHRARTDGATTASSRWPPWSRSRPTPRGGENPRAARGPSPRPARGRDAWTSFLKSLVRRANLWLGWGFGCCGASSGSRGQTPFGDDAGRDGHEPAAGGGGGAEGRRGEPVRGPEHRPARPSRSGARIMRPRRSPERPSRSCPVGTRSGRVGRGAVARNHALGCDDVAAWSRGTGAALPSRPARRGSGAGPARARPRLEARPVTLPCVARAGSSSARASTSTARRWPAGSARRRPRRSPRPRRPDGTSWAARRARRDRGPTCATRALGAGTRVAPRSTASRRTGRASTRPAASQASGAGCTPSASTGRPSSCRPPCPGGAVTSTG